MKLSLFIAFVFSSFTLLGQENKNTDCPTDRTYTKPQFAPVFGVNENDLQNFFDTSFATVKKTKCKMSLTLLIDSSGKASCTSVTFYTPGDIEETVVKNIIAKMPNWKPGKMNNCDVPVVLPIFLELTKQSVKVIYKKIQIG